MKKSNLHEYIMDDVFSNIEGVTSRAMFGGYGLYKNGHIFGLIAANEIYFKVDDTNKEDYEKRGSSHFVYSRGKHKKTKMPYMKVPEEILEDSKQIESWINKSADITKNRKK